MTNNRYVHYPKHRRAVMPASPRQAWIDADRVAFGNIA